MFTVAIILAMLMQVGPNPQGGGLPGDDLVRDRPPRDGASADAAEATTQWLADCLDQIAVDPARAHSKAQIRRSETTGTDRVLANHCLGTAATALGRWEDARAAFLAAHAETPGDEPRARARFAMMAGNAALGGDDAEGALALLELARSDARSAAATTLEALAATDMARALVLLGRSDAALAALDSATTLAPERSEGWLLKATLLRRLSRLGDAQIAIERAALLNPADPAIGLEAGVIAVLDGREDAARQSWQSVITLAPQSPAAATAQDYLAQVGPPADPALAVPPTQEPPA